MTSHRTDFPPASYSSGSSRSFDAKKHSAFIELVCKNSDKVTNRNIGMSSLFSSKKVT